MRKLRILTWHVHGNYLYSLTQVPHDFVIPVYRDGRNGYSRLGTKIPWGANVSEVPAEQIAEEEFDCVIYQSRTVYEDERHTLLSERQLALPSVYIEHDPPMPHPTDTRHWFKHDRGILVQVTHYNALAWDAGDTTVRVIEHGIPDNASVGYTGEFERGITAINHLKQRGRRMGADIFEWSRDRVAIDLIGMRSEDMGGLGEVSNMEVGAAMARYRFFFTPIRYTSLGLALVEAMLAGVPVVGVAATELAGVIISGVNGFVHTDKQILVDVMRQLVAEPELARRWGAEGRRTALSRFGIGRFVEDWLTVLADVVSQG